MQPLPQPLQGGSQALPLEHGRAQFSAQSPGAVHRFNEQLDRFRSGHGSAPIRPGKLERFQSQTRSHEQGLKVIMQNLRQALALTLFGLG